MSFPRYPEYKDSGVEWLGSVPAHWMVAPLKRGFSVTLGKMLQPESSGPDDELRPYLRAANIQWTGVDVSDVKQMWLSPRDREQLALQLYDLLVSEGGDVGRSCLWGDEIANCSFQNSVNRVRAIQDGSTRFLYYWMSTIKDKGYVDVLCNKSTIAHFTAEKLAAVPTPFPPVQEQSRIATFLDHETAKIDALVAEQEKLIALLQEKRQAVISHAVTKGLDPNVPMKDSGVEWLGEVPAHWDVKRVKHVKAHEPNSFVDGPFGSNLKSEHYVEDGDVYVIESSFATQGVLDASNLKTISREHFNSIDRSEACAGDIIIAKIGAQFGKCSILPTLDKPAVVSGNSLKLSVNPNVMNVGLMCWQLVNLKQVGAIDLIVNLTAQPALSLGSMNELPILVPPATEQTQIIKTLTLKLEQYDTLTVEARTAITLLQERRTALISAAVTGQIDVRDLASCPTV